MLFYKSKLKRNLKQGKDIPCFCYKKIDSTNTKAKSLILKGKINERCAVFALEQTQGRGRFDRKFLSEANKGVYLSYVTKCSENYSALACFAAVAVVKTLKSLYNVTADIKYPNDVLVKGAKICGILPQSVEYNGERYVILGVGLNINYTKKQLEVLNINATSAKIETGKSQDLLKASQTLAENLYEVCQKAAEQYDVMVLEFCSHLNIVGKRISFDSGKQVGRVTGVNNDCSLLVETERGKLSLNWGEIFVIDEQKSNLVLKF